MAELTASSTDLFALYCRGSRRESVMDLRDDGGGLEACWDVAVVKMSMNTGDS